MEKKKTHASKFFFEGDEELGEMIAPFLKKMQTTIRIWGYTIFHV
jgi:hypothetical protein